MTGHRSARSISRATIEHVLKKVLGFFESGMLPLRKSTGRIEPRLRLIGNPAGVRFSDGWYYFLAEGVG